MSTETNTPAEADKSSGYRIGAVANLTGISPDALRVWEKRYAIIEPERTPSGTRIYSQADLTRLTLIKRLLDAGDSISSLAGLDIPTLKDRVATLNSARQVHEPGTLRPCRAVVIGTNTAKRLAETAGEFENFDLLGAYASMQGLAELKLAVKPDVLIIELPTLNDNHIEMLSQWRDQVGASVVLVIYRFCRDNLKTQLTRNRCILLRAPVDLTTVHRYCEAIVRQVLAEKKTSKLELPILAEPIPARRYNDETLARMANLSSTIKCECPHHLAELIMALNAFETYSAQCENQTPTDASLHAYLHGATAQARHTMETALAHLLEVEQIPPEE